MVLKYRKHSTRDKAYIEQNGRRTYLKGKFNSPESVKHYERVINKQPTPITVETVPDGVTVADILLRFDLWSEKHFGKGRTRHGVYKTAGGKLTAYLGMQAKDFGPLALIELRDRLESSGENVRSYINYTVNGIRYIFNWAASRQLIPVKTHTELMTVVALDEGHTTAPESKRKFALKADWVRSILPHTSRNVQRMIRLQWLTGVRSGSLWRAKPEQFTLGKKRCTWRPRHKTERSGVELVIPLGPKARRLVSELLAECPAGEYLFSPRRLRNNWRYRSHYDSEVYRHAIYKAIASANKNRSENDKIPHWSPHNIRHTVGQRVRNRFGLEAAQATLGHESISATQIYARRRIRLARKVAAAIG